MGQLDQKWDKVTFFSFDYPARSFHLRELSRLAKLPKTTLERYLRVLVKENLIKKEKKGLFYAYRANESNFFYKLYKRDKLIGQIYRSGLTDFLEEGVHPEDIILFGSSEARAGKGWFDREDALVGK